MRRDLADRIVAHLLDWELPARAIDTTASRCLVRVRVDRHTEARWDLIAPWGLCAQVRRYERLIGLTPIIAGSDGSLSAVDLALLIARSEYTLDPSYPLPAQDRREVVPDWNFELGVGATARFTVGTPAPEVGRVPKPRSLHVVVSDLHDEVRA